MPRTRHRWAELVVVVGLLASLTGTAGASPLPAQIDLTTQAGIAQYLWSIGIDPATATIQTGPRNYAGPNCPGSGWNCAAAIGPIVQIAQGGGQNQFVCTPVSRRVPPTQDPHTCVIVQTGPGSNVARCVERTSANPAEQLCDITQMSTGGNNRASVLQVVEQVEGNSDVSQEADQTARISQTSEGGSNVASVVQRVEQSTQSQDDAITQVQEADQDAFIDQTSESGDNSSSVVQTQDQEAVAEGGASITQQQNASELDGSNQDASVVQNSSLEPGVGGDQASFVRQLINQGADADTEAGPVTQTQGSFDGGQSILEDQSSSGVSTHTNDQDKVQDWEAETDGFLNRSRFDPTRCCAGTTQVGNEANTCDIDQTVVQEGGNAENSFADVEAFETTSGNCTADQSVTQDGVTTTNSAEGSEIFIFIFCVEGQCASGEIGEDEEVFSVSGTVVDAQTGGPVSGATVAVAETEFSAITAEDGSYTIEGLLPGTYSIVASAPGYVAASMNVEVVDEPVTANFALSPEGDITVVLQWGAEPRDLDLHMSGPDGTGEGRFHVYFAAPVHDDYVSLDVDDVNGMGPETITVDESESRDNTFVAGMYQVWVHRFAGEGTFLDGDPTATITLNGTEGQLAQFDVADAEGEVTDYWLVATFDVSSAGEVSNIVVEQRFVASEPPL
jgi:hypothetical protein